MDDVRTWKDKILTDKPALLAVATHSAGEFETIDQTNLREALERNWGLSEQRNTVLELLDRMDATMNEVLEEIKERRDHWIKSIAVGLGTAFVLAEAMRLFKEKFTMNAYDWQLKLFPEKATPELVNAAHRAEKLEWLVFLVALAGLAFRLVSLLEEEEQYYGVQIGFKLDSGSPLLEQEGWPCHQTISPKASFERHGRGGQFGMTTPSALSKVASQHFLDAQPPLLFQEGLPLAKLQTTQL